MVTFLPRNFGRVWRLSKLLRLNQFNAEPYLQCRYVSKIPGYYLVFPDIPNDTASSNPLLNFPTGDAIPKIANVTSQNCIKALGKTVIEFESSLEEIEHLLENKTDLSLDEILSAMEKSFVPLDYVMSLVKMLYLVNGNKYRFDNFVAFFERIVKTRSKRFYNESIYYFMREMDAGRDSLNDNQKQVVQKYLLESRLSGINLSVSQKKVLDLAIMNLQKSKAEFKMKLEEATKYFAHTIENPHLLNVFPDDFIAKIGSHNRATITLHSSVFNPFMEYCPDRLLRWNVWQAYNSRCSPKRDSQHNNSLVIEEIRRSRRQQANVLGFENFVDLSLQTKMANIDTLRNMVSTLNANNNSKFNDCLQELNKFACENLVDEELELWDLPYWQRKLLINKYRIDDDLVRQYFPFDAVLRGLFQFSEKIFNIRIEEVPTGQFESWHKDVRLFRIISENGLSATFFLDPYFRSTGKRNANWADFCSSSCKSLGTKPISFIVTNFPPPVLKQPSLLTFNDVQRLFKLFGQVLQQSLSQIPYYEVSGTTNIEWDAANIVPDFFALWALNNYDVLSSCTSHVTNKSEITEEFFEKVKNAHYHFSSINLKFELYRIALDLSLYSNKEHWEEIAKEVWQDYMQPFKKQKEDVHPCSFRQIFCDNYPAAYFTFKWSEVLAADVFNAFQEVDMTDSDELQKVGLRFRDTFLSSGGGLKAAEVFRKFRGRDPSVNAYLEINGLSNIEKKSTKIVKEKEPLASAKAEI